MFSIVRPVNRMVHIGGLYGSLTWTIWSTGWTIEFLEALSGNVGVFLNLCPYTMFAVACPSDSGSRGG